MPVDLQKQVELLEDQVFDLEDRLNDLAELIEKQKPPPHEIERLFGELRAVAARFMEEGETRELKEQEARLYHQVNDEWAYALKHEKRGELLRLHRVAEDYNRWIAEEVNPFLKEQGSKAKQRDLQRRREERAYWVQQARFVEEDFQGADTSDLAAQLLEGMREADRVHH